MQHVSWLCWCAGVKHRDGVDRHGEGQVETWRADELEVVNDECEARTEGPRWPEA